MAGQASPLALFEKLAAFADIADRRGLVPTDEETIASWLIHSGSRTLTATLTVGDARRAREMVLKAATARAKAAKEEPPKKEETKRKKAAFAD